MENKEYILLFKSGDWQKVICKDLKFITNKEKDKIESVDFEVDESAGENVTPLFINVNEIVGIFPSRKKVKEVKEINNKKRHSIISSLEKEN